MFVIAEVIHGNVYALDGNGKVWRLSIGNDGLPVLEQRAAVERAEVNRLAEPRLIRWLRDV